MGLLSDATRTAFDALAGINLLQQVTITRKSSGGYNPATGEVAYTVGVIIGRGIFVSYNARDRNNDPEIRPDDLKLLFEAVDATLVPVTDDVVTDAAGVKYNVESLEEPTTAERTIFSIRVRPIQ